MATSTESPHRSSAVGFIAPTKSLDRISTVGSITTQRELPGRVSAHSATTPRDLSERRSTVGLICPTKLPESVSATRGTTITTGGARPGQPSRQNKRRKLTMWQLVVMGLVVLIFLAMVTLFGVLCIRKTWAKLNNNTGQPLNRGSAGNINNENEEEDEILHEENSGKVL